MRKTSKITMYSMALILAVTLIMAGGIVKAEPVSQKVGAYVVPDLTKMPPDGMLRVAVVQCHGADAEGKRYTCPPYDNRKGMEKCKGQDIVMEKVMGFIDEAVEKHAKLIVFPEMILPQDQTVPGPASDAFAKKCKEKNCYVVLGANELFGIDRYNVDYLVGPEGLIGKYHKTHPWGWEQQKVKIGELGYPVFDTPIGRIGLIVCYDLWFPEPARIMALRGADILAFSTWAIKDPAGEAMFDHVMQTRGMENHVWILGADIADPSGIGRSQIIDPWGDVVAQAGSGEEVLYADIDVKAATRDKQLQPGNIASDIWSERLPETYKLIATPLSELHLFAPNVPYGAHYK